jgi:SAM-dependent methyltransferase
MTQPVSDRWTAGAAYEDYMGRWSRLLARTFLEWLHAKSGGHWLEVGCGTGALTGSICAFGDPSSVVACEPSAPLVDHARRNVSDPRVSFVQANAGALPSRDGGFDVIASGLVLNFVPEVEAALGAMRERARPGGVVSAYVWDYTGGLEFLAHFWQEAVALDAKAGELDESRRFGRWKEPMLEALFRGAGLGEVRTAPVEIATEFEHFDDFWRPFLGGTGPAPSYVASLDQTRREALRDRLKARLAAGRGEPIVLRARASAVRGVRA